LPEWTFDRKHISANSNLNPNFNPSPNSNFKALKPFGKIK